ncbi:hypothetical protein A2U01_0098274, partial [Trifolium medium]|nr:hypothetical protein [Trifolium medium]
SGTIETRTVMADLVLGNCDDLELMRKRYYYIVNDYETAFVLGIIEEGRTISE